MFFIKTGLSCSALNLVIPAVVEKARPLEVESNHWPCKW